MSSIRPPDLPDYDRPPLVEVVLSIQFAPLAGFGTLHAALLGEQFLSEFPKHQEQLPLPPAFEVFGLNPIATPQIQISVGVPAVRFLFDKEDGSEVIQIQNNRFVHNWRKLKEGQEYLHYEKLRKHFREEVKKLEDYLREHNFEGLRPNQCEVIYINHISLPDFSNPYNNLHRVLSFLAQPNFGHNAPQLEDSTLQLRFILRDKGENIGRLHVHAVPVLHIVGQQPLIQLTLTARGRPHDETVESAFDFMDLARDAIVRGFDSITTSEMHSYWGKKNGQ